LLVIAAVDASCDAQAIDAGHSGSRRRSDDRHRRVFADGPCFRRIAMNDPVRLHNGRSCAFTQAQVGKLRVADRVRVTGDRLRRI
jgi:hypothetical protein